MRLLLGFLATVVILIGSISLNVWSLNTLLFVGRGIQALQPNLDRLMVLAADQQANAAQLTDHFAESSGMARAAIERNELAMRYYRKGVLALSHSANAHKAIREFSSAAEVRDDFLPAHKQLLDLYIRVGNHTEARRVAEKIAQFIGAEDIKKVDDLKDESTRCMKAHEDSAYELCITSCTDALKIADLSSYLVYKRADCHKASGDLGQYIHDMNTFYALNPPENTQQLQQAVSHHMDLQYNPHMALALAQHAVNISPEDAGISRIRKTVKAIKGAVDAADKLIEENQARRADELLFGENKALGASVASIVSDRSSAWTKANPKFNLRMTLLLQKIYEAGCEISLDGGTVLMVHKKAAALLKDNPKSVQALMVEAKRLTREGSYAAAQEKLKVAEEAAKSESNNRLLEKIHDLHQKAQPAVKKPKRVDYYAILDVDRSASDKDLKRAYRKQSKHFHPDRAHQSGLSKQEAEHKMQAINAAYEVLTTPDKRRLFDQGIDPNDPHAMHQNPFQQQAPPRNPYAGQHGHPGFAPNMNEALKKMEEEMRRYKAQAAKSFGAGFF